MYSVVLATMLAAGSTTPNWCHSYCSGCYGCYSSCSCSSYGYARHHSIFHRGYGSCYSSGCSSCYRGCSGCSCYGGCTSNAYIPYSYGCSCSGFTSYGCCGGTFAPQSFVPQSFVPRVVPVPSSSSEVEMLRKEVQELRNKLNMKSESVPAPSKKSARVTVSLPNDARLWIENVECPLTSTVRSFNTPALDPNQRYFYNVTMQIVRNGQTLRESQRVLIVPGQEVNVEFDGANAVAAR